MSLDVKLKDGTGNGKTACVFDDQSLFVTPAPYPPLGSQKTLPFRQYFTTDGTASGDNDMQKSASSGSLVDFCIPGDPDRDRYITTISFEIADASATLNKFGNITALSNGVHIFYEITGLGNIDIHDALKSNWDFVRLCLGNPGFGDAANAFKANNVSGSSEGYIPVLDLTRLVPPYGVKIDGGSNNKFVIRVRDDTTGVDSFNAIAYGFERLL